MLEKDRVYTKDLTVQDMYDTLADKRFQIYINEYIGLVDEQVAVPVVFKILDVKKFYATLSETEDNPLVIIKRKYDSLDVMDLDGVIYNETKQYIEDNVRNLILLGVHVLPHKGVL